jgi:hypothetical protein
VLNLRLLVIVPCGQAKIWKKEPNHGPAKAKDAYVGAPFKVNKAFAERFADKWIILSAKHGLIDPEFIIPKDYNVTFTDLSTDPISVDDLLKQLKQKKLDICDLVIALGGEDYSSILKKVFMKASKVRAPTEGLPIGKAMGRIEYLIAFDKEQMLKVIGGL